VSVIFFETNDKMTVCHASGKFVFSLSLPPGCISLRRDGLAHVIEANGKKAACARGRGG